MPSYDGNRRVRLPSFTSRMREIRGVSAVEKGLLIRIGNLIDNQVFERQINNTGEARGRNLRSEEVEAPGSPTATAIIGGIEVKWDAIENIKGNLPDGFDKYEVQHSSSSTFASPTTIPVYTNRIVIKGFADADEVFIRVRTVTRRGNVSTWTPIAGNSVVIDNATFDQDGDAVIFENTTRIIPQPSTVGTDLTLTGKAFVGTGGAIGPGPISFIDPTSIEQHENQISYSLIEDELQVQAKQAGLITSFYDFFYDPSNRSYSTPSGSFVDFFTITTSIFTKPAYSVRYLDYLFEAAAFPGFYLNSHEQTGVIWNAVASIIGFT